MGGPVTVLSVIRMTALVVTLLNTLLTLVVLARDPRSRLHQVYVLWGVSVTLWNFGVFSLSDPQIAHPFFWAKMLQLGVIFMPISLFHLCLVISQSKMRWYLPILYCVHGAFAVSLFYDKFITGVRWIHVGYWSIAGPAFHIFSYFYVVLTTALVMVLYQKQKIAPPTQRMRLRALLVGIVGLWIFGTNDLLPMLPIMDSNSISDINGTTILFYPFTRFKFYPLGGLSALFYVVIVGYSVLQHQLLDIHVTMSRVAAQIVRLLFMFLICFALLLLIWGLNPAWFNVYSFVASLGVLLVSASMASFFFPQFFGRGTDALERHILGDSFEYHARVQNVIQAIRSFPDPQFIMQELEELLATVMKVRSYQLILLDEPSRSFTLFYSYPPQPGISLPDNQINSPIFRFFQQTREKFLACNPVYSTSRETALEKQAREQLRVFEPEFCFPFFTGNDLVGLMLLGPKANEDLFTPHDLRLLTELSQSLGLLLNQMRLRHQLQVAHEQDLLGRMSRGLAHDLNNLLTPVQTLLQLLQESDLNQETIDELLPVGLRNLATVRSYVNEALFFSRSAQLHAQAGSLDETINSASALVKTAADEKQIQIHRLGIAGVEIEMDTVLIKRLLCNLLSNAIDASPSGSTIEIHLSLLPKTELSRDWYRLKIIDHGEGISAENLQRVFTPYFTTKNTGEGKRGFGLGLAIARKIVHLHGGNISINSKEGKGTTLQLDLPSKLAQAPMHTHFTPAVHESSNRVIAA
jgi:signal transduction histidine kinase